MEPFAESASSRSPQTTRRNKLPSALRVTDRDASLLSAVCLGRFLSFEQLRNLFFATATEPVARKRLRELCGAGRCPARPALLRSVPFRRLDGGVGTAYLLTEAGYDVASEKLGRAIPPPPTRGQVEFVLHQLGLNEALIGLARQHHAKQPGRAPHPNFRALPFTWWPSHTMQLPWRERPLAANGEYVNRLLAPDAVLEFSAQRRRLFLEFETGSHPIAPPTGAVAARSC